MRNIEASNWLKNPLLTLIQASSKESSKPNEKQNDRMIGFNLQAVEAVDAQSNLNKLLKEDKGPAVTPNNAAVPTPKPNTK